MNTRPPKVIKKADIERRRAYERQAEIAYLEILIQRNPEPARKFVRKHVEKREEVL